VVASLACGSGSCRGRLPGLYAAENRPASEELFNIPEIAGPARGPFVPQEVFLADERHLDAAVSPPDRLGTGICIPDASNPIQQIDSDRFDADPPTIM
jgi:hypothetical protein